MIDLILGVVLLLWIAAGVAGMVRYYRRVLGEHNDAND